MKWISRYMQLAQLVSTWSKDPKLKVGAVVVDEYVRGCGFNGPPRGVREDFHEKNAITVHAEVNALLAAAGRGHSLFVYPVSPCISCAAYIIQSGIKNLYTLSPNVTSKKWRSNEGIQMLQEAGVICISFTVEQLLLNTSVNGFSQNSEVTPFIM